MLDNISIISNVAVSLITTFASIKSFRVDKRENIVVFLNEVADTLEDVIHQFENNKIPHGSCEKMRMYSAALVEVLQGTIDDERLSVYSESLYKAHEIEMLYKRVRDDEFALIELRKASGLFRAAAVLVNVSK